MEEGYQEGAQEEKGREEGEEDEEREERTVRDEINSEVIVGIQKKAIGEDVESNEKRTGGQGFMRSWDCSQIENEEEEVS